MTEPQVGLELDTAVAMRVMGWRLESWGERMYWTQEPPGTLTTKGWAGPPPYSTTMLYAWKIVEKLRSEGLVYFVIGSEPDGTWDVEWTTHGCFVVPPRGGSFTAARPRQRPSAALRWLWPSSPPRRGGEAMADCSNVGLAVGFALSGFGVGLFLIIVAVGWAVRS